jgi:hypothetical protein
MSLPVDTTPDVPAGAWDDPQTLAVQAARCRQPGAQGADGDPHAGDRASAERGTVRPSRGEDLAGAHDSRRHLVRSRVIRHEVPQRLPPDCRRTTNSAAEEDMAAGSSAGIEAQRSLLRAEAHEKEAASERRRAGRFAVAAETELRTASRLAPLAAMGYHQLADRRWPGTGDANVDLLLVGPGGVFVVDTKCWADVRIAGDRLLRDQADVTEELDGLLRVAELAEVDLAEVGLAPSEVAPVVVLAGHRGIRETLGRVTVVGEHDVLALVLRRGTRLTDAQVDLVATRLMTLFPPMSAPQQPTTATAAAVAAIVEPVLAAPSAPTEEDLALLGEDDVREAVLEAALAAPVEEWMTFLHPDQARLVRRSWNGPARVRGAAGTGKTVVGLHRTAYLTATRPGRVLYTSYVRTLPQVLRQLYARMSPQTVDRVDFVNVHRFAIDLLRSRGVRFKVDLSGANRAYAAAWAEAGKPGLLKKVPQPWTYWQDEIDYVVKGRGLTDFRNYADLDRVGRRYPLTVEQRLAVWELYRAYLQDRGIHDLADVVSMAERELEREPLEPGYVAVVADEVQDLSCVAVRMLHRLVGDSPDGLLLIGDGQQSVYPGGFTLPEAGVSVTGRASVLRVNYRNTAQILQAANAVVANDRFSDLDGLDELGERDVECARTGPQPVRVDAEDTPSHDVALLDWVERTTQRVGVGLGDIAVLAARHKTLEHYRRLLAGDGLPYLDLDRYDGAPVAAVKLGTFKRAKGLEFKHVALPQLVDGPSTRWSEETADAYRERIELERRELFVGMTRARDGLWLGYVGRS